MLLTDYTPAISSVRSGIDLHAVFVPANLAEGSRYLNEASPSRNTPARRAQTVSLSSKLEIVLEVIGYMYLRTK